MIICVLLLYIFNVQSLIVKTTMTAYYSVKLIDNGFIHPWVYDRDEFQNVDDKTDQAFVDWKNVLVR